MNNRFPFRWLIGVFLLLGFTHLFAQTIPWYKHYYYGLEAMKSGDYRKAADHFQAALQTKDEDTKKIRAYGIVFIEYYPHRELGICLYHLGQLQEARNQLETSLSEAPSKRAQHYLDLIVAQLSTASQSQNSEQIQPPAAHPQAEPTAGKSNQSQAENSEIVGERMSIAVLPFSNQGIGAELKGVDLLDKLITAFVNSKRFKVIERAQLEKVIEEQKLGLSGIVEPTTAAEIGKGIGVDAVVVGSITRAGDALSMDARMIDTESAAIISAQTTYSPDISMAGITTMVTELSRKFKYDLPIVRGLVIKVDGDRITLDMGSSKNIKRGMKCLVYREGEPIIHPVTKNVIGRMIDRVCVVRITDVMPGYSIAVLERTLSGMPRKLDKVVTK